MLIKDISRNKFTNSALSKECIHFNLNKNIYNFLYCDFFLDGNFFLPISKKNLMTSTEVFGIFSKKKYSNYFHKNYINFLNSNSDQLKVINNSFIVGSSENYFHSLIDYFPRLFTINKNLLNQIDSIAVGKSFPKKSKMLEYLLKKLNLRKKIIFLDRQTYLFKNSIFPLNLDYQKRITPLKNILKQQKENNSYRNIYISRRDSKNRKITNEKNLINYLKKYNFETYVLSELNFIDQIKLFEEAKIIVSLHGAGLANLIFSNAKTKIIEISPSLDFNSKNDWFECPNDEHRRNSGLSRNHFKLISNINNIEHFFYFSSIIGAPSFNQWKDSGNITKVDLTVNLNSFSKFFENNIMC